MIKRDIEKERVRESVTRSRVRVDEVPFVSTSVGLVMGVELCLALGLGSQPFQRLIQNNERDREIEREKGYDCF
jgi:hypothetical protein